MGILRTDSAHFFAETTPTPTKTVANQRQQRSRMLQEMRAPHPMLVNGITAHRGNRLADKAKSSVPGFASVAVYS